MWDMNKSLEDFRKVSENLRYDGQESRADVVDYLIERIELRENQLKEFRELVESASENFKENMQKYADEI